MKTILKYSVAIAFCLILTSCWLPEAFVATLHVDKDKKYKFTFDGTIVFAPVLDVLQKKGQLSPEDEAEMKQLAEELRKLAGFQKVEYLGKGKCKVKFEESGPVQNDKKFFLDLVQFKVAPSGRIMVQGTEITAEDRKALTGSHFKLDGNLSVTTDLAVVKENAASRPSLGGRIGAYKWKINLDQAERPEIVLQP